MTLTATLPFIVFIALNGQPQNSFYNNMAYITYTDTVQPSIVRNNENYTSYFTNIEYTYNLELYYDDANSFRLDFNSIEFRWINKSFAQPQYNLDNWHYTFTFTDNDSYTYDTINNFQPSIKFSTDAEDDMLIVRVYNGNTLLAYTDYDDSGCVIAFNDDYQINFDMTNFRSSLTAFMSATGDYAAEYNNGYETGYTNGYDTGYTSGVADGYSIGFNDGSSVDSTAIIIFNGILNIALVPINFFLAIFNFEILGINMSGLVTSLLSICLIIIVVRFVTGKKQGGGD